MTMTVTVTKKTETSAWSVELVAQSTASMLMTTFIASTGFGGS